MFTRLAEVFIDGEWRTIPFTSIKKDMIISLWDSSGVQVIEKSSINYPNYLVTKDAYESKDGFWVFEFKTKDE